MHSIIVKHWLLYVLFPTWIKKEFWEKKNLNKRKENNANEWSHSLRSIKSLSHHENDKGTTTIHLASTHSKRKTE